MEKGLYNYESGLRKTEQPQDQFIQWVGENFAAFDIAMTAFKSEKGFDSN